MLPYINVPGTRISWLVAMAGVLADVGPPGRGVKVGVRALRSSMVLRQVLMQITSDRAPDETVMRHAGAWVQNSNSAAMVHYFSNRAAATTLGGMVRRQPICAPVPPPARVWRLIARVCLCSSTPA